MKSAALTSIVIAAIISGGCNKHAVKLKSNSNEHAVKLKGNYSAARAKTFHRFPVYYAGNEVAGIPLTAVNQDPITAPPGTAMARKISRVRRPSTIDFSYGSCVVPFGGESCGLPLDIQVWPACARYPALYHNQLLNGPIPKKARIRGVPAAYFESGYRVEIQTGASTIVIFGDRKRISAAVAALQGLNNNVRPGGKLPAPARGALDGSLPCA